MKSIIRVMLLGMICLVAAQPVSAQLSDVHYLPPLKQRSNAIIDQLIYLSTPETTPFQVAVYIGTSTTPVYIKLLASR